MIIGVTINEADELPQTCDSCNLLRLENLHVPKRDGTLKICQETMYFTVCLQCTVIFLCDLSTD